MKRIKVKGDRVNIVKRFLFLADRYIAYLGISFGQLRPPGVHFCVISE